MFQSYRHDKRSGITYVYECRSYRVEGVKNPRSKAILIGRLDQATGEIVPTDGRMQKAKERKDSNDFVAAKPTQCTRQYFGATYLLDQIGEHLGITDDLKRCFPSHYKQILSIVYYMILEDKNPLYRFEKWNVTHYHPYGKDIPSQRSSELFQNITQGNIEHFLQLQIKHRQDKEYYIYDTTSISSYSEVLKQAQYGHNKENDKIPQFNLSLVFGEQSELPFFYRKMAGNIPDVKTLKNLVNELQFLGHKNLKLISDKGFFSIDNINNMLKERVKFIISAKTSLKFIKEQIEKVHNGIQQLQNFNDIYQLHSVTIPVDWPYHSKEQHKNKTVQRNHQIYAHVYFNIMQMAEKQNKFDRELLDLRAELLTGKLQPNHENLYNKYFTVEKDSSNRVKVTINEEIVKQEKRFFGYFVILSAEKMDSISALELYRNKDIIEKAFGNLKDRLNLRRTLVSSESSLDGKLFVGYVALIILAYIKRQMQKKKLFKTYTISQLLDKLDLIECFNYPGRKLQVGEVLEKQKQIYLDMEVKPPL